MAGTQPHQGAHQDLSKCDFQLFVKQIFQCNFEILTLIKKWNPQWSQAFKIICKKGQIFQAAFMASWPDKSIGQYCSYCHCWKCVSKVKTSISYLAALWQRKLPQIFFQWQFDGPQVYHDGKSLFSQIRRGYLVAEKCFHVLVPLVVLHSQISYEINVWTKN